jgi:hypothetical protein
MSKPKMSNKSLPPLPEGYVPPMPYADVRPRCKTACKRNVFTWRDGPTRDDRAFGYFCSACEKTPFWLD